MTDAYEQLSRRERQIMDVLYARGEATSNDVQAALPEAPSTMAVRRLMQILEEKGHIKRRKEGRSVIYRPAGQRKRAGQAGLRRVVETFFGGSPTDALLAHLEDPKTDLSPDEIKRLAEVIQQARRKGGSR